MVLRSGGHANYNRFRIAANVNPIRLAFARSRIAVQRRTDRDSHCARSANSRPRGRLRIARQRKAPVRLKELYDLREQRQFITLPVHQLPERRETFLALRVSGNQPDAFVARLLRFDPAVSVPGDWGMHVTIAGP